MYCTLHTHAPQQGLKPCALRQCSTKKQSERTAKCVKCVIKSFSLDYSIGYICISNLYNEIIFELYCAPRIHRMEWKTLSTIYSASSNARYSRRGIFQFVSNSIYIRRITDRTRLLLNDSVVWLCNIMSFLKNKKYVSTVVLFCVREIKALREIAHQGPSTKG